MTNRLSSICDRRKPPNGFPWSTLFAAASNLVGLVSVLVLLVTVALRFWRNRNETPPQESSTWVPRFVRDAIRESTTDT
jgi:hypothetical protein